MKICTIKNSHQIFFKTLKDTKSQKFFKLRYVRKFSWFIELILNFLSLFLKIEIYNLMPQYGYYPTKASKITTIFWDAAHLYEDSLDERTLYQYKRGLSATNEITYFFQDNFKELMKINPMYSYKARKIKFAADFTTKVKTDPVHRDIDIIYVASTQKRKNIQDFVAIIKKVSAKYPSLKAVIVGNHSEHAFRNLKVFQNLSDDELNNLYARSKIFLNTSSYEGIGLPNLEAKFLGCKVICNDIPIFREVMGEAAQYINTGDIALTSNFILSSLYDLEENSTLIKNNNIQIEKYLNLRRLEML